MFLSIDQGGVRDSGGDDEKSGEASGADTGAVNAPATFGHYSAGDAEGLEEFPVPSTVLTELVSHSLSEQKLNDLTCAGDIDITAGKPSTTCTYLIDGEEHAAYAYGTYSNVKGTGVLITYGAPLDENIAASFTEPGTEVLTFGAGDMWGVDSPVSAGDVASQVQAAMDAYEMQARNVTCADDLDMSAEKNMTTCNVEAEWGQAKATVIGGYAASMQENGVLIILPVPVE